MFRLAHHDFDCVHYCRKLCLPSEELLFQTTLLSYHHHNPAGCAIFATSAGLQRIFGLGNAHAIRLAPTLRCTLLQNRWVRTSAPSAVIHQTAGRPQPSCSNVDGPCTKENRGKIELYVIKIAQTENERKNYNSRNQNFKTSATLSLSKTWIRTKVQGDLLI